jgi:uncharacterized protein with ParB-like and HNH nuclease domain
MECEIATISRVFHNGGIIHYVLPHFQREYIWDKEQWRELLRDLFFVYQQEPHNNGKALIHFLGLMVLVPDLRKSGTVTRYKVVDGQQRLVTISLIISILKEMSKKKTRKVKASEKTYCTEMMERMLINDLERGNERLKVLPNTRRGDCAAYMNILDGQLSKVKNSRIGDAYRYLQREISKRMSGKDSAEIEKLYSALVDSFQVALVFLDKDDEIESPYKIFESMDGKGRLLAQGDLVRNYIAMTLPLNLQQQVFEQDWSKIEELLQEQHKIGQVGELTAFLRHYLAMRRRMLYPEERVYARFRDYIEQKYSATAIFVQEISVIRRFAEHYHKLLNPEREPDYTIRNGLQRLSVFEVSIAYPLLLAAYDTYCSGRITSEEFVYLLAMMENLLVRRYLCSESQAALAKWFTVVWDDIHARWEQQSFTDACRGALSPTKYYPTDRQLRQAVQTVKLYSSGRGKSSRAKITLILTSIEEHLWGDTEIIPTLRGNPSIEHILPQTLTDAWKKELGEQSEQIHTTYVHTLGNLTLVTQGKNSQLSNASFAAKRNQLLHQGFQLNKYFDKNIPYWNDNAILMRADWLTQQILEIWPSLAEEFSLI